MDCIYITLPSKAFYNLLRTHSHTLDGSKLGGLTTRRNLDFSVLLKDILTCLQEEVNHQPCN